MVLFCGWRGSNPPDYPAALLNTRTCIDTVLDFIYARVPAKPPKIDKSQRDAQIYQLHLQGVVKNELAKQFQLSEKHIERIIREKRQKL